MAAAGQNQERVEFAKECLGPALLICQVFALGSLNFALNAALVKLLEQGLEVRAEIKNLQRE